MRLLTLNLSCENVLYPAQKHFEKTNNTLVEQSQSTVTSGSASGSTTPKTRLPQGFIIGRICSLQLPPIKKKEKKTT